MIIFELPRWAKVWFIVLIVVSVVMIMMVKC